MYERNSFVGKMLLTNKVLWWCMTILADIFLLDKGENIILLDIFGSF
jgi:hypothetical protein